MGYQMIKLNAANRLRAWTEVHSDAFEGWINSLQFEYDRPDGADYVIVDASYGEVKSKLRSDGWTDNGDGEFSKGDHACALAREGADKTRVIDRGWTLAKQTEVNMKLEAAKRLVTALSEEQLMQSLPTLLGQQGIEFCIPDDGGDSLVANTEISKVLVALAMDRWIPVEQREVVGGMYCWGRAVTMLRGELRINVLSTSQFRTTIWLPRKAGTWT
jgi:hypothetical protein